MNPRKIFHWLIALSVMLWLAVGGALKGRLTGGLRAVGYYWHFVDAVWIVVFSVVYLRGLL